MKLRYVGFFTRIIHFPIIKFRINVETHKYFKHISKNDDLGTNLIINLFGLKIIIDLG